MASLNLFVNYYQTPDPKRQAEIDFCLKKNKKIFDKIVLFDRRPMYHNFFEQTAKYPNDVNVFSNADIYFNETAKLLHTIKEHEAYAITRWEHSKDGPLKFVVRNHYNKHAEPRHSQDVWAFRGEVKGVAGRFYIGIPGCDNRIAWEIKRAYRLYNPCESIQCIHYHAEETRIYNIPENYADRIPRPYHFVNPCRIDEDGTYDVIEEPLNPASPAYQRLRTRRRMERRKGR